MKKFMLILAVLLTAQSGRACDVCGCAGASGTYFPGTMNGESQFGLSYQYLAFKSRHLPSILQGQLGEERISSEKFHLMNLGVRYRFLPNWQAIVQAPYQVVLKSDQGIHTRISGMADIQLGLARQVSFDSLKGLDRWIWVAEYDLKLPTGTYTTQDLSEQVSRFMFPGTGSFDHFFRLSSQLKRKNWLLSFGGLFRLNGEGPDQLNWGNRLQAQSELGRSIKLKNKHELFFSMGYVYEHSRSDFQKGVELPFSSYSIGQAKLSIQWRKASWAAAGIVYLPVHGGLAEGRVTMTQRFQIQLIYFPKF
ncbi:MAG TPA: hypothetical protein DIW47_13985 [Bacteroidetes bacterium]|nr:hypothetical protein [Bacteroidota bacterium]